MNDRPRGELPVGLFRLWSSRRKRGWWLAFRIAMIEVEIARLERLLEREFGTLEVGPIHRDIAKLADRRAALLRHSGLSR